MFDGYALVRLRDYELQALLGRGQGVTRYAGRDALTGRPVGLQVVDEVMHSFEGFATLLTDAARRMAHWHDAGALTIRDVVIEGSLVALVTEPCWALCLGDVVGPGSILQGIEAVAVIDAVLGALERAHQAGFVHGGLTDMTVLIGVDGTVRLDGFVLSLARAEVHAEAATDVEASPPAVEVDIRDADALFRRMLGSEVSRGVLSESIPDSITTLRDALHARISSEFNSSEFNADAAAALLGGRVTKELDRRGLAWVSSRDSGSAPTFSAPTFSATSSPAPAVMPRRAAVPLAVPPRHRRGTAGLAAVLILGGGWLVASRPWAPLGLGNHPAPAAALGPTRELKAVLTHVPRGSVTLTFSPVTGALTVDLALAGLSPGTHHPSHIHVGSCGHQSAVIHPLSTVVADGGGRAHVITVVRALRERGIPVQGWYVNVHNGPGFAVANEFEPLVCVDVVNPVAQNSLTLPLLQGPPGTPSQAATGTAAAVIQGDATTVTITAAGLAPGKSGAVELRSGTCDHLGKPVAALPGLSADDLGRADETATVAVPAQVRGRPLAAAVHRAPAGPTPASDDIVLCGDLVAVT